jgi:hypothetical protein
MCTTDVIEKQGLISLTTFCHDYPNTRSLQEASIEGHHHDRGVPLGFLSPVHRKLPPCVTREICEKTLTSVIILVPIAQ